MIGKEIYYNVRANDRKIKALTFDFFKIKEHGNG